MTDEYDYLIRLLRCAMDGTAPEPIPDGLSAEAVFECGRQHEVANLAYLAVCRLAPPPDEGLLARWKEEYLLAVRRSAEQEQARKTILAALHGDGIDTLEVQGTVVKRYYPQPHLRMMSDLDFIVPANATERAEKILRGLGYTTKIPHKGELNAQKGSVCAEIHTEFFEPKTTERRVLSDPFSHVTKIKDHTATVSDTDFYLFHLLHTIKHCEHRGSGIRRIVDLYYLENAMRQKADFEKIDSALSAHGLYEIKNRLLAVMQHWFCGIPPEADVADFEEQILGAWFRGLDEDGYWEEQFRRQKEKGKRFVRVRYLVLFLFPAKEDLYFAYPFCRQHRLPLPLCWIYRGIASLFKKENRKTAGAVLARVFRPKK